MNTKQLLASLMVGFIVVIAGCGGGPAVPTTLDKQAQAGDAEAAKASTDPKVEEATTRCRQEVEKSEMEPGNQLAKIQIQACLYAKKVEIAKCSKGIKRELKMKITIDKTGTVTNAFPIGDSADSPEATCVADVVKTVAFPKFKSLEPQVIKYPFKLGE